MNQTQNEVPEGFTLLQRENGKAVYAACMTGRFAGWLMWKHPDGQWVSKRKLEARELMQVEDQRDDGIVQETTATPAPAMGEELPPLPAFRAMGLFSADQMHAYGRACMALRQPGAASGDEREALADLRKAVQDGVSDEWLLGFVRQRPLTPAAPVSQPIYQVCWDANRVPPRWYDVPEAEYSDDHGGTRRIVYTPPAPLSAPAGSEQEKGSLTCPNCGTDRMKSPCPRTVHECPMIGHAQQEQSK